MTLNRSWWQWGSGGIEPLILHLDTTCRWVVSVRNGCLNTPAPPAPTEWRTIQTCRRRDKPLASAGNRTRFSEVQHAARSVYQMSYTTRAHSYCTHRTSRASHSCGWLMAVSWRKHSHACHVVILHSDVNSLMQFACLSQTHIKWHQGLSKFTNLRNRHVVTNKLRKQLTRRRVSPILERYGVYAKFRENRSGGSNIEKDGGEGSGIPFLSKPNPTKQHNAINRVGWPWQHARYISFGTKN